MDEKTHWLDRPKNIKLLWRGFLLVLVATVVAEWFIHLHASFEVDALFGFSAWFGFLTCIAMIVVAKGLSLFLKRSDTYYDTHDD